MDPNAIPDADRFTADANQRITELVADASEAARLLGGFTSGAGLDVTRLALHGTDEQLDAWRDTRPGDAHLLLLVAEWRERWRLAHRSNLRLGNLLPRGLDVYGWTEPEACDHEQVRLGADVVQRDGQRHINLIHVDVVRAAQQPTTMRLLGPSAAEELFHGADGITQDGHPLRSGTTLRSPHYRPDQPTWIPDAPPPHVGRHIPWDPAEHARAINEQRAIEQALGIPAQ